VTQPPTGWSRLRAVLRSLPDRLQELQPPPLERCGTSVWRGALKVIVGTLRGLFAGYRDARVEVAGGLRATVDLSTPHGRRVFAYGFCEPAARAMRSLLQPGDVVIDGGANIGLFTLLAAALVGSEGRVIGCEPSPATMDLLRANVDRNRLDWVELREVALAEQEGRLTMRVFEPGSGYSSFTPASTEASAEVEVRVITLDQIAQGVARRVGLVKLDVEGAELRALRGASWLLAESRPDFIIELEPEHLGRQGSSVAEVQALFDNAGYVGYSIDDGLKRLPGVWTRPMRDPNIVVRPGERVND
jgi:FkbM family methyltransferase